MTNPIVRFWRELQRRKVIRVAIAYVVVSWVAIEVSSVVFPALLLPEWSHRLVIALAVLGFPVALVMSWVFELSADGLKRESPKAGEQLLPLSSAAWRDEGVANPAELSDGRRSIVVLPFTNLSTEAGSEFFSDGITEEILSLLARQPDLRVVSRTTSFSFKGSQSGLRDIARKLNVEMVLEGSVRRSDRQLRIMAQLIDPNTDAQLWSDRYDRELTDVFAVQGDIARQIVDALQLDPESCMECAPQTQQIEAYDYYLRGRQYFHQLTQNSLDFARQMFRQAISIDPGYARAWAGLADTESMIASWYDSSPDQFSKADEASQKALDLAPELAEAHSARGHALTVNGDYAGAARCFEHALELEPNNYDTLYLYGRSRFAEGKLSEAAHLWERAHQAQPDDVQAIALHEGALRGLGHHEAHAALLPEAVRVVRQRLELAPDDQRVLNLGSGVMISAGLKEEGLAMIERLIQLNPNDGTTLYNAACAFARAGLEEKALDAIERRMTIGWINRDWLEHDHDFDGLRKHPRFCKLLSSLPDKPEAG